MGIIDAMTSPDCKTILITGGTSGSSATGTGSTLELETTEKPADGVEYRHVERVAAKFWRSFSLPETANPDGIDASYKDGILEIRVPKAEEAKPKHIELK